LNHRVLANPSKFGKHPNAFIRMTYRKKEKDDMKLECLE